MKSEQRDYISIIENNKITLKKDTSGELTTVLLAIGAMAVAIYFTKEIAYTISLAIFLILSSVIAMSSLPFQVEIDSLTLKVRYKLFPYKLFPGFIRTKVFPRDTIDSIVAEPINAKLFNDKNISVQIKVLTNQNKFHSVFYVKHSSLEEAKKESEKLASLIAGKLGI